MRKKFLLLFWFYNVYKWNILFPFQDCAIGIKLLPKIKFVFYLSLYYETRKTDRQREKIAFTSGYTNFSIYAELLNSKWGKSKLLQMIR